MNLLELLLLVFELLHVLLDLGRLVLQEVEDFLEGLRAHSKDLVLIFSDQILEDFKQVVHGCFFFVVRIAFFKAFGEFLGVNSHG